MSGLGGSPSFGSFGSPGYVSPFDMQALQFGQGQAMTAMTDRYAQLGLSAHGATPTSPGGLAGGIGVGNIGKPITFPPGGTPGVIGDTGLGMGDLAGGTGGAPNLGPPSGGPGGVTASIGDMPTAERMDLGYLPSLTGGIPGEFEAILGEMQNNNLSNASQSGGGGGGKGGGGGGGGLGGLGSLAAVGGK